jgi:4-hydroxybenzoate polyprenyltransferase/phosphoserine phosphatase
LIEKPLVVDLDGTLILTDMLHESVLRVLKDRPFDTLRIPFLLLKGKAYLKQHLASNIEFDPITLPYNEELLEWLKQERVSGRRLILCTASDKKIADIIADHLGIFDEVIASDGVLNVAGENKAAALLTLFERHGYDYVGNSNKDLPVWSQAHRAVVVNGSNELIKKAHDVATVERVFPKRPIGFSSWRQVLRIHQWLKNLLLFVPLFAAHDLSNGQAWGSTFLAFVAFSLCASSVYIANDLLDLESDRQHPRKRNRPFASGIVPAWVGVLFAPILLIVSLGVATLVGQQFLYWLIFYFALTCAYSWVLKRLMLIDCLTLALLYTLRIIAGAAAVGHGLSFWLLAFSVFLFLSLAFVKRYAELEVQLLSGKEKIHGRGYHIADASLIQTMGIVAGYSSVLVLALYLNSDAVLRLYAAPELIWGAVPVMLFWVSWMWMQAHRGKMHDDPLVFAVKDRASLGAAATFAAILVAGSVGVPW